MKEATEHYNALDGKLTDELLVQAIAEYTQLREMIKSLQDPSFSLFLREITQRVEEFESVKFCRENR